MTETMQALVVLEPDKFEIQDVPVPEPGPMEVLCRVKAVSICGTDSVPPPESGRSCCSRSMRWSSATTTSMRIWLRYRGRIQ